MTTLRAFPVVAAAAAIHAAACGGIAVVDDGEGGAASSVATGGSTKAAGSSKATSGAVKASTAVAVVSSGSSAASGAFCDGHEDCAVLELCSFVTGRCARTCDAGSPPCPPDLTCLPCGTSSCPQCDDCLAVCGQTF